VLTAPQEKEPVAEPVAIAKAAVPAPAPTEALDPVTDALRAMSYGIVSELQKPVQTPAPKTTVASTTKAFGGQTYTVQQGDSLPGIAFRFFGTTVAYLDILAANEDVLTDPGDLQAGMVLRIPTNP
jgi:nucleoid-associated protein YgaU